MTFELTFHHLEAMSKELLDLRPDGWTCNPLQDAVKLAEEVGEVAECMVKSRKGKSDLAEELSDVLSVILVIALRHKIDLNEAHIKKQSKRVNKLLNRFHEGIYPSK